MERMKIVSLCHNFSGFVLAVSFRDIKRLAKKHRGKNPPWNLLEPVCGFTVATSRGIQFLEGFHVKRWRMTIYVTSCLCFLMGKCRTKQNGYERSGWKAYIWKKSDMTNLTEGKGFWIAISCFFSANCDFTSDRRMTWCLNMMTWCWSWGSEAFFFGILIWRLMDLKLGCRLQPTNPSQDGKRYWENWRLFLFG